MAAHRYWRAVAMEAYGAGDIELSEFHLLASGVRVDAPAVLTSSIAPDVAGVLSSLQDDVLATSARWSEKAVKTLVLSWDFGSAPADVDGIQLAGESEMRFLLMVKIQWSDTVTEWTDWIVEQGIAWPGAATKSELLSYDAKTLLLLHCDGADGAKVFSDSSPYARVVSVVGAAVTSTAEKKFGIASARFNGAGSYLTVGGIPANFLQSDFTIDFQYRPTALGSDEAIVHFHNGSYQGLNIHQSGGRLIVDDGANASPFHPPVLASAATFYHIEVSRVGGRILTFVDGVMLANDPVQEYVSISSVMVGRYYTGLVISDANCHVDELRISYKTARHTQNFTPPLYEYRPGVLKNTVNGRASKEEVFTVGIGPEISYGGTVPAASGRLDVESGFPDLITGVLGKGIGRVRGTIEEKGTPAAPVHRRVRLVRERDGMVIREQWSDPTTGAYDFQYVDELQRYTVVSYDHTHNYRAVIADNLTPEVMP